MCGQKLVNEKRTVQKIETMIGEHALMAQIETSEVFMQKDPVIQRFLMQLKHPAVLTFLFFLAILIILGLIIEYIRPEDLSQLRMV